MRGPANFDSFNLATVCDMFGKIFGRLREVKSTPNSVVRSTDVSFNYLPKKTGGS